METKQKSEIVSINQLSPGDKFHFITFDSGKMVPAKRIWIFVRNEAPITSVYSDGTSSSWKTKWSRNVYKHNS